MLTELRLVIDLEFDVIALEHLISFLRSRDYETQSLFVISEARLVLVLTVSKVFDLFDRLELVDFIEPLVLDIIDALVEQAGVEVVTAHII